MTNKADRLVSLTLYFRGIHIQNHIRHAEGNPLMNKADNLVSLTYAYVEYSGHTEPYPYPGRWKIVSYV